MGTRVRPIAAVPALWQRQGVVSGLFWNLAGQGLPLLVAVFAIPLLIRDLGLDRFGVLALAWMLVGYFGLFDLGIGRAVTQFVARALGERRDAEIPLIVSTALGALAVLGVLGAFVLWLATPWVVTTALRIPPPLQPETASALTVLALTLPLLLLTAALRALLEAYRSFALANVIRIPLGIWTFAAPLAVAVFSPRLDHLVMALAAGRVAALAAHVWACRMVAREAFGAPRFAAQTLRALLAYGGWITVSNVISPLMVYADRLLIGAILGTAAVALYVTPFEVVVRLSLVPDALCGALFPALTTALVENSKRAAELFDRAAKAILLLVFPLCLTMASFAREGLAFWIDPAFANESFRVLQWLSVGFFVNALARVPHALLQAAGRADVTAKVHLLELPIYLPAMWLATVEWGINGAAAAWTLRAALDLGLLTYPALKICGRSSVMLRTLGFAGAFLVMLAAIVAADSITVRESLFAVGLTSSVLVTWRYVLGAEDRAVAKASFVRMYRRAS